MASDWIAERVSVIDYDGRCATSARDRDDVAWGPNNRFVFPADRRHGRDLSPARRSVAPTGSATATRSSRSTPTTGRVRVAGDGSELGYDALVSTMPLDLLVGT